MEDKTKKNHEAETAIQTIMDNFADDQPAIRITFGKQSSREITKKDAHQLKGRMEGFRQSEPESLVDISQTWKTKAKRGGCASTGASEPEMLQGEKFQQRQEHCCETPE